MNDIDQTSDTLNLAPADGLTEAERVARSIRIPAPAFYEEPTAKRTRPQFTMASLLMVSLFVSVGLSGSTWMPASLFAGVLGVLLLTALVWTRSTDPETRLLRNLWQGILLAYVIASVVAVVRIAIS